MAEMLVLEFDGVDESNYNKVNTELGIDQSAGTGDWPAGLVTHIGGEVDDGRLYVVEVWDSRQAQAEFMSSRLGPALAAGGISAMPKVSWARLLGHSNPGL